MIFSLSGLLVKLLKSAVDAEVAKQTPVGGTVTAKGVAHGVKAFGHKWEIDCVLRRTE